MKDEGVVIGVKVKARIDLYRLSSLGSMARLRFVYKITFHEHAWESHDLNHKRNVKLTYIVLLHNLITKNVGQCVTQFIITPIYDI